MPENTKKCRKKLPPGSWCGWMYGDKSRLQHNVKMETLETKWKPNGNRILYKKCRVILSDVVVGNQSSILTTFMVGDNIIL